MHKGESRSTKKPYNITSLAFNCQSKSLGHPSWKKWGSWLLAFMIGTSKEFIVIFTPFTPTPVYPLGILIYIGPTYKIHLSSHYGISSVQFSRSVVSDSLWPHESQHARPPCPHFVSATSTYSQSIRLYTNLPEQDKGPSIICLPTLNKKDDFTKYLPWWLRR